jgi:citrate lyase subunit beta/citryl-CoA lyase
LVETAAGIVNLPELVRVASSIEAFCFGHADFSRDMGLTAAASDAGAIGHARTALAIAAKAARRMAIDTVYLDVRDSKAFRGDAEHGLSVGFDGKLCIHPSQLSIANEVFTPTPAEIDYARRVVEAYHSAEREGRGVFTVDGKMVDAPLIEIQRDVLERARSAGVLTDGAPTSGEGREKP